jgi:hypothetical protein
MYEFLLGRKECNPSSKECERCNAADTTKEYELGNPKIEYYTDSPSIFILNK